MRRRHARPRRRTFAPEALEARRLLAYAPAGPAFEVGGAVPGEDGFRSTVDLRGRVTVVWEAGDGSGYGVYARRYDAGGTPLGDAFRLNADATGDQVAARVVDDDSGATTVAWWSGSQLRFRRFDPEGAPTGGDGVLPGTDGLPRDFEVYEQDGGGFAVYADGFQLRWYDADGRLLRASTALPTSGGWTTVESQAPGRALIEEDGSGVLLTWSEYVARMSGGAIVYDVRVVTGDFAADGSLARRDVHATAPGLADPGLATEQDPTILRLPTGSTFPGTEWNWLLAWRGLGPSGPVMRGSQIVPNGVPQGTTFNLGGAGYGEPTAVAATPSGRVAVHYIRPGATGFDAGEVRIWGPARTFPWEAPTWVSGAAIPTPADPAGSFQALSIVPTVGGDFWILRDDGAGSLVARRVFEAGSWTQFARQNLSVGEAGGRVVSWVVRYGDLSQPATVPYFTYDVGAFAGHDFVALSGALTFAPGRSDAAIVLTILDDRAPDPNKAVILGLGNATGSTQRVDLIDDEPAEAYELAFVDYGAYGLWTYNDLLGWAKINDADAQAVVASGNRTAYVDFGPYGLWSWDGVRGWLKLNDVDPEAMVVIDPDPGVVFTAGTRLFVDFGPQGLWSWGTSWDRIDAEDPARLTSDGATLMVDLPASGLRSWNASTGYEDVYAHRPSSIAAGPSGYLLDYGPSGLWSYRVGGIPGSSSFRKVDVAPPQGTAVGYAGSYLDYGPDGLWRWSPSWDPMLDEVIRLSTADPGRIVATGYGAVVDFGVAGLWLWDSQASTFAKLNDLIPDVMAVDADARDAYFGFASGGLWRWWGSGWLKINDATPQAVARM